MSESAGSPDEPVAIHVTPAPSQDELAAILAAYDQLWPDESQATVPGATPRWKFSGRWWAPRPRYGGWV